MAELQVQKVKEAEDIGMQAETAGGEDPLALGPTKSKKRIRRGRSRDVTPIPAKVDSVGQIPANGAAVSKRRKSTSTQMTAAATRLLPLLVCSIGNPGSTYANTLHSAGHTVVTKLAEHLDYPAFRKERDLGNGLVAKPPIAGSSGDWTLWQSTSYMNDSGKGVRAAFTKWSKTIPVGEEGKLVVVYDELEKPLGTITVRTAQGASAKGHNGLKSIMSAMGNTPFARIGVGIGRPASRASDDVAQYVLKKMTPEEKANIEESASEVITKLRQLEKV
jgi:peptidyl-tRNA hydrolase, PTH1 family